MSSPEGESDQVLGAYVRMLKKAVAGFDPSDEQARYDVYRRARDFLTRGLGERNDLSQSEIEAELRIFAEAALYVERQARSLHSVQLKAKTFTQLKDASKARRTLIKRHHRQFQLHSGHALEDQIGPGQNLLFVALGVYFE